LKNSALAVVATVSLKEMAATLQEVLGVEASMESPKIIWWMIAK